MNEKFSMNIGPGTVIGAIPGRDRRRSMAKTTVKDSIAAAKMQQQMSEACATDLAGVAEIAEMAAVSKQCISNWKARHPDFPAPLVDLASGPVFSRAAVQRWLNARKQHGA